MLRAKFLGEKRVALGKGLSLALVRDLNERALTLLEKDLDIVVHESKEKTEETGLETVELSNEGKSAWFNLKDTAILQIIHLHKIKRVFMGVFHSWSRTWIFKIGSGSLPMCC